MITSFIGLVYFWSRSQGFSGLSADSSFQQRIETIRTGLEMFADRPLLGVGIGCSIVAWPLYASSDVLFRGALVNHNTFIQALSETGILGFLLFALLLAASLHHARKLAASGRAQGDGRIARMGAALEASLLGFMACGLAGGYVVSWFPYLILGLIGSATLLAKSVASPVGQGSLTLDSVKSANL
jgi:O-antigen ligase